MLVTPKSLTLFNFCMIGLFTFEVQKSLCSGYFLFGSIGMLILLRQCIVLTREKTK